MRNGVVVFGSLNMDLVVRVPRMPEAGETLGGRVAMAGRVGNDGFGQALRAALAAHGVNGQAVATTEGCSTGVAMIIVDDAAQNCIAVVPGATGEASEAAAQELRTRLESSGLLLLQLEVPMPAVVRAAETARAAGCRVVLNPAPAQDLPDALWPLVDLLVLNETGASHAVRPAFRGRARLPKPPPCWRAAGQAT